MYKRAEYQVITDRMKEPRKFIQVVMGARQIGSASRFGLANPPCSARPLSWVQLIRANYFR